MGAMSSSLNIRNMNWSMQMAAWLREESIDAERERIKADCQIIRDSMTQAEYDAWWNETPASNNEFVKAVGAKLAELALVASCINHTAKP